VWRIEPAYTEGEWYSHDALDQARMTLGLSPVERDEVLSNRKH
jgi:hypothetical protein